MKEISSAQAKYFERNSLHSLKCVSLQQMKCSWDKIWHHLLELSLSLAIY